MEETTIKPTTPEVNTQQSQKRKKTGIILLLILLIIVIPALLYTLRPQMFTTPFFGSKTPQDKVIAKVGAETFLAKDLVAFAANDNYSLLPKNLQENNKAKNSASELEGTYLQSLINQSLVLQYGRDQGYIQLPNDLLSGNKDFQKRKALASIVAEKVTKTITHADVEAINIFFEGTATASAKTKIEEARRQVINKTLTMKEIGKQLDGEAYQHYPSVEKPTVLYRDSALTKNIFTLQTGAVSDIYPLTNHKRDFNTGFVENKLIGYVFFHILSRTDGTIDSVWQWIQEAKKKYPVTTSL